MSITNMQETLVTSGRDSGEKSALLAVPDTFLANLAEIAATQQQAVMVVDQGPGRASVVPTQAFIYQKHL